MVRLLVVFLAIFIICGGISSQAHASKTVDGKGFYSAKQEIASQSRGKIIRIRPGSGKKPKSKQKFPKPPIGNMKRQ